MSINSFAHLFRVTTWGESHGPAIGCVVDGCPPGLTLSEADLQPWLDLRRPVSSKFNTPFPGHAHKWLLAKAGVVHADPG